MRGQVLNGDAVVGVDEPAQAAVAMGGDQRIAESVAAKLRPPPDVWSGWPIGPRISRERSPDLQRAGAAVEMQRRERPRTSGVPPRGGQVRRMGGVIAKPASSSWTRPMSSAAAVLHGRPGLLHPFGHRLLVPLARNLGRELLT